MASQILSTSSKNAPTTFTLSTGSTIPKTLFKDDQVLHRLSTQSMSEGQILQRPVPNGPIINGHFEVRVAETGTLFSLRKKHAAKSHFDNSAQSAQHLHAAREALFEKLKEQAEGKAKSKAKAKAKAEAVENAVPAPALTPDESDNSSDSESDSDFEIVGDDVPEFASLKMEDDGFLLV